jgi:trk system potassium uptake protein TrkH
MNVGIITFILGCVLRIEAVLMIFPCIVAVIYRESAGYWFLLIAIISGLIGQILSEKKPENMVFYLKEGCVATALSWIVMSFVGCLPFYLSKEIPSFTDALFETISGFTTTGASILSDVEALSKCTLFWRSFSHWIGGMGVLVFLLTIISLSGGSHMNLMRAESPGPSVGKFVPKVRATAQILYLIYLGMTVVQFILLLIGRLPVLDAMLLTFGTAGTGGFGILNTGLAEYSGYVQWVIAIFMILFGVNFNAYYLILLKKFKQAFGMEEIKAYFLLILASCAVIFMNIYDHTMTALDTLRHVVFQVGTLVTSTGYSTVDFDMWPSLSKAVLVLLMFIGACAGSTGGGIKVSRIIILLKAVGRELNAYLHPKSVRTIQMEDKPLDKEVIGSVGVYFVTFMIVFSVSVLLVSIEGYDMITNFTAVLATLNNMGPGLAKVGPTQNYGFLSDLSKYVLMFDMLAGRLELFPMLILFHPVLWKEAWEHSKTKKQRH